MLYATTKDVLISIVILMKAAVAHAEAKEAKALRTEMSMSQKSSRNHWKTRFRKNVITLIE